MKTLAIVAWAFFAVDVLIVGSLFVARNMGDDAAGRGMATGFAIVLTPIVLAVGALLLWAHRSGSKAGLWASVLLTGIPFWFLLANILGEARSSLFGALRHSRSLRFPDPTLSAVAKAIEAKDPARVRALANGSRLDFGARNSEGVTILGFAVRRVIGMYRAPEDLESVRALLDAGAPPASDVLGPEEVLLEQVLGGNDPLAHELLRLLFGAGADPDVVDRFDRRPLIFSTYMDQPELEIFAEAGANLGALDTRSDRPGWTALMNAGYMRQWDQALFLLDRGVPVDHVGRDGTTLAKIMDEHAAGSEATDPGFTALREALLTRSGAPPKRQ